MKGKRLIRLLRWSGALVILAAVGFLTRGEIGMSGNEASRFAVVQAVGEQGVFFIEKTNFRTVDKVIRNGHVYSDKPPALAWALGIFWRIPHRWLGFSFEEDYHWSVWMINFLLGASTSLLLYLWLFNALRREARGPLVLKWLLALAAPLNGWLLAYSTVLNNHTPAALAAFGVWIALTKFRRRSTAAAALLAGFAAGIAGAMELPAGAFFGAAAVLGIGVSAPRGKRLLRAAQCAGAGLLCVAGLLLLNLHAYGTWLPLYLAGDTATYSMPVPAGRDFAGYCVDTLVWTRGLLSYQPFLLLAFPWLWCARRRLRAAEYAVLAAVAATILFHLVGTNEYGGAAYGFRYFVTVIPILWHFAARGVLAAWVRRSRRGMRFAAAGCAALLIVWGAVTGAVGAYAPFCVAFEGYRSPPGHFTRAIQSTFCGNLLCIAYDHAPRSALTRAMIRHYGWRNAYPFLHHSFFSLKRLDILQRINDDLAERMRKTPAR